MSEAGSRVEPLPLTPLFDAGERCPEEKLRHSGQ